MSQEKIDRWAQSLAGLAQTGMAFTQSPYDRERYTHLLSIVEEMQIYGGALPIDSDEETPDTAALLAAVVPGIHGYVTPKVAVGALVVNDDKELLLIKRTDNGMWLYPTGWCDIGYSPAEVAIKEVREETGIEFEIDRVAMVLDGLQLGLVGVPAMYSIVFFGHAVSGDLQGLEHEVSDIGWFGRNTLPSPIATYDTWGQLAWQMVDGNYKEVWFNPPR